jgi:hypothetical protein
MSFIRMGVCVWGGNKRSVQFQHETCVLTCFLHSSASVCHFPETEKHRDNCHAISEDPPSISFQTKAYEHVFYLHYDIPNYNTVQYRVILRKPKSKFVTAVKTPVLFSWPHLRLLHPSSMFPENYCLGHRNSHSLACTKTSKISTVCILDQALLLFTVLLTIIKHQKMYFQINIG